MFAQNILTFNVEHNGVIHKVARVMQIPIVASAHHHRVVGHACQLVLVLRPLRVQLEHTLRAIAIVVVVTASEANKQNKLKQ